MEYLEVHLARYPDCKGRLRLPEYPDSGKHLNLAKQRLRELSLG